MPEDWKAHRQALAEAQAWCALKLDVAEPATSLRSTELKPDGYPSEWEYGVFNLQATNKVVQRRRQILLTSAASSAQVRGQILCVFGNSDLYMGEGDLPSGGVIDEIYLPPWDSWFALITLDPAIEFNIPSLLLAWIPAELVQAVQNAIEVAATEPLAWLSDRFEGEGLVARTFRQVQQEFGLSPA
jgi:hypothetical protein